MYKSILTLLLFLFSGACISSSKSPKPTIGSSAASHYIPKLTNVISNETGSQLLGEITPGKYHNLRKYWVAQKENYCGVCSAVIILNTSRDNNHLTQDNIFTDDIKEIILPETVSKMGLTLRELSEILSIKAKDLKTVRYPAHTSGLDLFRKQLTDNNENQSFMVVNFSRQSIAGTGMKRGHFSIVAGYHTESKQVLILEVNGGKESFWISDKDLFTAMMAIDPVSQIPRGWVVTGK